jgi:solute carrier family 25 carnitine/acylcarnitine transporter 20/29
MGKDDSPSVVFLKDFTAGQFAGMAQVLVGHPLDTIKVVLQTQPNPPIYKSATDCARAILKSDGPSGFFKGMLSPLFVVGVQNAMLFAFYGASQKAILGAKRITEAQMSFVDTFTCGAVAGVACAPLTGPMELVKSQLQVQRGRGDNYMGTFKYTQHLVKTHGIAVLTRGLGATVVREAPAYGMFYGVYFTAKRKLSAAYPDASSFAIQIPSACLAGLGYWGSCFPIDVAKSKMQCEPLGKPFRYTNVFSTMQQIVAQEGAGGLFKGIGPCFVRAFPAAIATFVTYEVVLKALN